jgi:Prokaryotic RING finger family 1
MYAGETICAICQTAFQPQDTNTVCPECKAEYHLECWQENGGCAIYGCAQVPATEHREAIEIMPSYWGQENKPCPRCSREILAAALRCRHCGATFSSSQPENANEYFRRADISDRQPATRGAIIWIFLLCAIPFFAPIGTVAGLTWYSFNRDRVKSLPTLYSGLCKIALAVGIGQSVLIIILLLTYTATKAR